MEKDAEMEVIRLLEAGDLKGVAAVIESIPGATVGPLPVSGHKLIIWRVAKLHNIPQLTLRTRTSILLALNSKAQPKLKVNQLSKYQRRRLRLYDAQGGICCYCEKKITFGNWTIDHVVPRSRGGAGTHQTISRDAVLAATTRRDQCPKRSTGRCGPDGLLKYSVDSCTISCSLMHMKATHIGECQICGRRQMLPGGVLSKHGYTVDHGFFSGICAGAHKLPFEKSCADIAAVMATVRAEMEMCALSIAQLNDINSDANGGAAAMAHEYSSYIGYHWVPVIVTIEEHVIAPGTKDEYRYATGTYTLKHPPTPRFGESSQPKARRIEVYDNTKKTLRDYVHHLNSKYAKHLQEINGQRKQWLDWQTARLANWKEQPLKARE